MGSLSNLGMCPNTLANWIMDPLFIKPVDSCSGSRCASLLGSIYMPCPFSRVPKVRVETEERRETEEHRASLVQLERLVSLEWLDLQDLVVQRDSVGLL